MQRMKIAHEQKELLLHCSLLNLHTIECEETIYSFSLEKATFEKLPVYDELLFLNLGGRVKSPFAEEL